MKNSTTLNTTLNNKTGIKPGLPVAIGTALALALFLASLFVGQFPLSLQKLFEGDELSVNVFFNLRLSRTIMGLIGGFALGIAGFVFQMIFKNPLAAPDIIGVSSGASAGAAAGILFFGSTAFILLCSFAGAILSVSLAILLSAFDKSGKKSSIVLAGIATHSLAQTALMFLKLTADPEKELASIEYWIMGSLGKITLSDIAVNLIICIVCIIIMFLLHRHTLLLSIGEDEAKSLGVSIFRLRIILLALATLCVSCVMSLTGIISFVGLIAPHCARKIRRTSDKVSMLLSGIIGGCLLLVADMAARGITENELPVSIFTSLLGAPFLIALIYKRRYEN